MAPATKKYSKDEMEAAVEQAVTLTEIHNAIGGLQDGQKNIIGTLATKEITCKSHAKNINRLWFAVLILGIFVIGVKEGTAILKFVKLVM